ncbi:MAG: molybdopterin-synthase adenylyltransferase MoeB [Gammaproteobacteria bacterium]|nr:molybdopterin-synthase adenylyltransferase MoeB [Gammaproteobacteria bacterium]
MKGMDRRLAELKAEISEVTPKEAETLLASGAVMIDVREVDEIANGSPKGAVRLGRGYLELRVEDAVPDKLKTVIMMCAGGVRSLFAAESLKQLGYQDVRSLRGGFNRWKNEGHAFEIPRTLNDVAKKRYSRHILLPEVRETGQLKLLDSKVLLIGAGGLGSPAAYYLAAAGVGTLGIVDHDVVDMSNLQRQILHRNDRVGAFKADSARETLEALNPDVKVVAYRTHLDASNVEEIFAGYDVVVDGTDNLATRYLINDACVKLGIPNVHGAVYRFEGQLTVFWPQHPTHPSGCYRCMFPKQPGAGAAPSCSEIGVLGVLPGVMGLLQAVEVLKLLLKIGDPLLGKMLYYDALKVSFHEFKVRKNPDCPWCSGKGPYPAYEDYAEVCAAPEK